MRNGAFGVKRNDRIPVYKDIDQTLAGACAGELRLDEEFGVMRFSAGLGSYVRRTT